LLLLLGGLGSAIQPRAAVPIQEVVKTTVNLKILTADNPLCTNRTYRVTVIP
jgi:hypothetical protein